MAQRCSVCSHPDAVEINEALLAGEQQKAVADRFGVTTASLSRHKHRHWPAAMAQDLSVSEFEPQGSLLEQLDHLVWEARRLKAKAEASGNLSVALQAVTQLGRFVELAARLRGELNETPTVNLVQVEAWPVVLQALEPFPKARLAVSEALHGRG